MNMAPAPDTLEALRALMAAQDDLHVAYLEVSPQLDPQRCLRLIESMTRLSVAIRALLANHQQTSDLIHHLNERVEVLQRARSEIGFRPPTSHSRSAAT